ncbi:MAG: hypothetical protein JO033_25465 [Acidobacteriaceae bacterium]|nr:hypothetical protein [Acidobacteriaceae bacterium]MBV9498697.1 hypothetical protein [Acidobacteriaceae bacterium]
MCWYSAEHAAKTLEAEAGQRLVIRKVHGSSWAVQEADLQKIRPTPVCLLDGTKVLFRFPEGEQTGLITQSESEAVFHMLSKPKRDVFRFADGRDVDANSLPADLVFDVLEIPGKEDLSAMLKDGHEVTEAAEPPRRRESLLERVLTFF